MRDDSWVDSPMIETERTVEVHLKDTA